MMPAGRCPDFGTAPPAGSWHFVPMVTYLGFRLGGEGRACIGRVSFFIGVFLLCVTVLWLCGRGGCSTGLLSKAGGVCWPLATDTCPDMAVPTGLASPNALALLVLPIICPTALHPIVWANGSLLQDSLLSPHRAVQWCRVCSAEGCKACPPQSYSALGYTILPLWPMPRVTKRRPCPRYPALLYKLALVQATVGVGTVKIVYVIIIRYEM